MHKVLLSNVSCDGWFRDAATSSFWIRIYTSLLVPHDKFVVSLQSAIKELALEQPVAISYGVQEGINVPHFQHYMYAGKNGMTVLEFASEQRALKKSNFVFIATPMAIDGKPGNPLRTRHRLDVAASVMRLHAGVNFMRDIVFEGEVTALDDKFVAPGEEIKMPQTPEGPFINEKNWGHIGEIAKSLTALSEESRRRIELALEYFDKAQQQEDAMFYYWTALEMLCGGRDKTIRLKLKECYELDNVDVVDRATGFGFISQWRHGFFNQGLRPSLSSDVRRYIQLLFLDLLRHELHLPWVGYLAAIQQAPGYNLEDIGLADNRVSAQR